MQEATETLAAQAAGLAPRTQRLQAGADFSSSTPSAANRNRTPLKGVARYLNVGCVQFLLHNLFQDDEGRFDGFFQRHGLQKKSLIDCVVEAQARTRTSTPL